MKKLVQLAKFIRSTHDGPAGITVDVIFKDAETYQKVKKLGVLTQETCARLYNLQPKDVTVYYMDTVSSIKVTLKSPVVSGDPDCCDYAMYQQNAPLLSVDVPL
jgi:hypothetical protein